MKRLLFSLTLILLTCATTFAQTATTLTVNASGTLAAASLPLTGTASLTGIGNGTFTATASFGASGNIVAPFTITLPGGTLTGTITAPAAILAGSGTATAAITGGTGTYAGSTGTFNSLAGTGGVSPTGSLQLTFTGAGTISTTGGPGPGGPTPPSITSVQNNYGQVSPGLPNYGLAPGSLFFVKGTNLSNSTSPGLLSSSSPGLPTTQDGVSVSVTAGGTTRQCPLYYLSPTQINAVLPGNTALGNATITVTNNGTTSAAYTIPVVQSAFGILFYNGSLAATYDLSNGLVASTNAANAGDYITLWGTGVGADAANDDRLFPQKQNDLTSIPMRAYLGSVEAQIYYRGRSQYPGVDQVIIIVPNNAPTGCYVSLSLVSGNIVSNSVTIPVAASGRTCADPGTTLSPEVFGGLAGKTTIKFGILSVVQSTSFVQGTARTDGSVGAFFQSVGGIGAASGVGSQISIGSCIIPQVDTVSSGVGTITGLDAGASIGVTGPGGSLNLTQISVPGVAAGFYLPPNSVTPPAFIPTGGGTFTFSGPGGRDVGSFNASLSMPTAFTWSNATAVTTVGRSQGVTVNWTGGAAGTYVQISGGSTANINGRQVTVSFTCSAPVSAGTFTVPVPVLLALPAGTGSLGVSNFTNFQTFTASGLDLGIVQGGYSTSKSLPFN